jgi:hypothetical protein
VPGQPKAVRASGESFPQGPEPPKPQSCLVYTQLPQRVLDDPGWANRLTPQDRRGLNPSFCSYVNSYGRFRLDMDTRLDLDVAGPVAV